MFTTFHSLVATANDTTLDTVIQCNSSVGFVMANITNLTIRNVIIRNCTTNCSHAGMNSVKQSVIFMHNCYKIQMHYIEIYNVQLKTGLLAYNILGSFNLSKIKSKGIRIVYTDDYINSLNFEQAILNISQFKWTTLKTEIAFNSNESDKIVNCYLAMLENPFSLIPSCIGYYGTIYGSKRNEITDSMKTSGIKLEILQTTYSVLVCISNATLENLYGDNLNSYLRYLNIELNGCNNSFQNIIYIKDLNFVNNTLRDTDRFITVSSMPCNRTCTKTKSDIIKLVNCKFIKNICIIESDVLVPSPSKDSNFNIYAEIYISGCLFQNDLLPFLYSSSLKNSTLIIENSRFEFIAIVSVIKLWNVQLILIGPVVFCNITTSQLIMTNSDITVYNYMECSNITASSLVIGTGQSKINIIEDAYVNITNNHFNGTLFQLKSSETYSFPLCPLQYYRKHAYLNRKNKLGHSKDPLMLIQSNNDINVSEIFDNNIGNVNCKWDPNSMYYRSTPLKVFEQNIQFIVEGNSIHIFDTGLLCLCPNRTQPNCFTNTLGPLYPGQSMEFYATLNPKLTNQSSVPISVKVYDDDLQHSLCIVKSMSEAEQIVNNTCTKLAYNIFSENQPQCKLILYNIEYKFPTVYYVNLLDCPAGFAMDDITKQCDCDQKLTSFGIVEECDIDNQTILRPANSWISATTHNNSYTYHISLECPFHYCLPYSSHLNLSTPNSQCQFNRSGQLCGHCQQGLSTVFSSHYCQRCSSLYLLLIIPISLAGMIMIVLLFYLNLTVTDGNINAFILYANIISINTPLFFPSISIFTPAYTFISLTNLDLGIQTCFYSGMDDYAKMWLQLVFPFYLIFIATLIILTSRYSTTIQRLTARRALPVLATLFLLSYTKILRIVSSVLFFYSTITNLPSKHTTVVWSVDASIPLFGFRFIILFVICVVLFCMLIPFNIILVFTKTLLQFKLINKFIPLIDAYCGPYQYELYYWTGYQLIIRSVFFGISALSRNVNLALGIVLLSIIVAIHGIMCPYKSAVKNLQELLYLFNLQTLYAISLYSRDVNNMIAVNVLIIMATLQFCVVFMYHMITYMCDGLIRKKIQVSVRTLIKCISRPSHDQQLELNDNLNHRSRIPEVTYNYHEYREPLICQD